MASYRRSEFLPMALGGALAAAMGPARRPVGREIDEVERQTLPVEELPMSEELTSLIPSGAVPEAPLSALGGAGVSPAEYYPSDPVDLSKVEDRRLFHPERYELTAARTVRGSRTRLDVSSSPQMASRIRYAVSSSSVITCIRRKIRREVMLASGRGGSNKYRPPQSMEVCE